MAPTLRQPCDILVRNAHILTVDASDTVHNPGAIAITGRDIVAVGPAAELEARFWPARTLDARGGLVHPGFVDMHNHGSMHLVSKMIAEAPLSSADPGPWVAQQYTRLINAVFDEEEYASGLLVGLDMLLAGITAFMDPGTVHEPEALAAAARTVGIRVSLADPWLMDIRGPQLSDIARAPLGLERALGLLGGQLRRNVDPASLVRGHVAIYGMGSQSDELALAAKAKADAAGAPFNMHQSQSVDDAHADDARLGGHPLVHFEQIGLLGPNNVFVHMNVVRDDEAAAVARSGMTVVHCPINSWFYASRPTYRSPFAALAGRGVHIALGSDVSKATGFGDVPLMAYMLARDQGDYFSPRDILRMHTMNGARAMGIADRLGSIEAGKRADLVIRRSDLPETWPRVNLERQHLLLARSKSVDTVIVDGRIVVKGGRHTLVDEAEIFRLADEAAQRMLARAGLA